jgi:hypothetical protein
LITWYRNPLVWAVAVLSVACIALVVKACTPTKPIPALPPAAVSAEISAARAEGSAAAMAGEAAAIEPKAEELREVIRETKKNTPKKVDTHALSDTDLAGLWSDAGF